MKGWILFSGIVAVCGLLALGMSDQPKPLMFPWTRIQVMVHDTIPVRHVDTVQVEAKTSHSADTVLYILCPVKGINTKVHYSEPLNWNRVDAGDVNERLVIVGNNNYAVFAMGSSSSCIVSRRPIN